MKKTKRILATVLALTLAFALFGCGGASGGGDYGGEETETEANIPEDPGVGDRFTFGMFDGNPIEWRVLDVADGKVLVISEEILTQQMYYKNLLSVTWETSDIRSWLNGEFYTAAFGSGDRDKIAETEVGNPDSEDYGTPGGNDTADKIFLLSLDEVNRYFADYADRAATYEQQITWWWLRSPGSLDYFASRIGGVGDVFTGGAVVNAPDGGVRPAMWINL
ncbi:MAG: DUF6273 domain-containing protein [Oscillospiraceae bacterium]|jgi:hypothetical protein|nr:DUF6273 domain-containing protein [Oscillospiraceae bacterium]